MDLTKQDTLKAIDEKYRDFEDDPRYAAVRTNQIMHIVTRNKREYIAGEEIRIENAEEFLKENRIK